MKISILHPSRGRGGVAKCCARHWIQNMSGDFDFEYILSLDIDDNSNYSDCIDFLSDYKHYVLFSKNRSIVDAVNIAAEKSSGDLLIVISDDFLCFPNWDKELLEAARGHDDFVIGVYDGIQKRCQTIPILSRKYYDRFGYIYNPEYFSMYCDAEFTNVAYLLNKVVDARHLTFKHNHYLVGGLPFDDTYARENSDEASRLGKSIYYSRMKTNYGLGPILKLSILIPSLSSRKELRENLINKIQNQIRVYNFYNDVEIIVEIDDGIMTIGKKRNILLNKAKGIFTVFIDDDDDVSDKYLINIISTINRYPSIDCIGFSGIITFGGENPHTFIHSIKNEYYEKDGIYYRPPNHLNPIKASIAKRFSFPEKDVCEDKEWCLKIKERGVLIEEEFIKENMYFYRSR